MEVLLKYFPDLTGKQIEQFSKIENLYRKWNEKINVISRKDIESLYLRHVLHSLSIAAIIRFVPGTRIMDVGTGGGFPGIPLAIMFPAAHFYLIDSIGKKIKVVNEIIRESGLENAVGITSRAEGIDDRFDFVVSRAVKSFPVFYSWVKNSIHPHSRNSLKNGILCLKGGDLREEMKSFKNKFTVYPIKNFFEEDFFGSKLIIYLPV